MMNKLQETQEAYSETAHKLSQVEIDNNILMRQLQALLPKEEVLLLLIIIIYFITWSV